MPLDIPLQNMPREHVLHRQAQRFSDIDQIAILTSLLFIRLAYDTFAALNEQFARHKLSDGKFNVLLQLLESPNYALTPSELAERISVTRGTITGLLDGLVRDGWVQRLHHDHDRRMVVIRLTDVGKNILEQFLPHYFRWHNTLMAGLTVDEQQTLRDLLRKIHGSVPSLNTTT